MDIGQLIELVKEQPAIYDGSHLKYRDRETLSAIWKMIAMQLNCNEHECRDKWHNLRGVYRRLKKKEKLKGSASNSCRRWAYYDMMDFLYPHTEEGKSSSNAQEQSQENCVLTVGEDNSDSEIHSALQELEFENNVQCGSTEENIQLVTIEKQPCEVKKRKLNSRNYDHENVVEVQHNTENTENVDESDADKMFLLSLLPFIKQLEPEDNLEFRVEVQQILRRILYRPLD